jgi:hypothetical protein
VPLCTAERGERVSPAFETLKTKKKREQYPEDLPIDLQEEVHIRADRSSITYRQKLAALGLGRTFTA